MLIATIITYNDWPLIKSTIESIKDKVDKIIVIDGRYRDFPGKCNTSTDGTLEYLNTIDNARVICVAGFNELGKRNEYLKHVKDGDTIINIDSDEVFHGDMCELKSDFGIINLHDKRHIQDRASRFFKFREGMEYRYVHFTLYYNDRQINTLYKVINPEFSFERISSFYFEHEWYKRDEVRRYNKELYYKKLRKAEAGFPR